MEQTGTGKLKRNILFSLGAQAVSLAVSLILSMVVPKFIDEYQYAYWQKYVLYVSYVGIFHFGLLDGLMLRYSQYDYDELKKETVRSQFRVSLFLTGVCALLAALGAAALLGGVDRRVFLLVAAGIVTKNLFTYASYTFQITNRIREYAAFTVANRAVYGLLVVGLLLLRVNRFEWYAGADLTADVAAVLCFFGVNRAMYIGRGMTGEETFREAKVNVRAGVPLLLANFSYMLLIGGAKMVTEWRFDELTFGKVSFAFSISNLFLTFVTAISVVLFPAIKRTPEGDLPRVYDKVRRIISVTLLAAMILYFPGCYILGRWLPNYSVSLAYLGLLLPIVVYTSKVTMLTNNYLKAYMEQKKLFVINMVSLGIAMALFLLSAYGLGSLELLLLSVVASIMLRSVWSEAAVMKRLGKSYVFEFLAEGLLTAVFILCARFMGLWTGGAVYAAAVVLYLAADRLRNRAASGKSRP